MKSALDVHRELLGHAVPHEIVRLPRPVFSADELPDVLQLAPEHCVAVRLYDVDDRLVAVLLHAGETPDPGALLAAAGGRSLRPARPDRVNRVTDYAAGLVAPLLLPADLPLFADESLLDAGVVYTPTGDSGTALGIPCTELLRRSGARVLDLRQRAGPAPITLPEEELIELTDQPARGWR